MPIELSSHEYLARLVRRAQQGDRKAFEELYRRTAQVQYFTISGKIGEEHAADLLQELYLITWRNIGKINPRAVVAYLNTTARNLCRAHLRSSNAPSAAVSVSNEDLELLNHDPANMRSDDPGEALAAGDERERLRRALIEHLTDEEREVLLMRYYQNLKLQEIAEETGLSLSTVKRTITRALSTLRTKMGVAIVPLAFSDALVAAVEQSPAPGAKPAIGARERLACNGARVASAVVLAAAATVAGVALLMPSLEAEVVLPVETAEAVELDVTPPSIVEQALEGGVVVLTIADDDSGVADAWCVSPDGTECRSIASADGVSADESGEGAQTRTFSFALENGAYDLHLTDVAGNSISIPLEVQHYPEP